MPKVIAVTGGAAPVDYTLGQSESFRPETVEATFDGSGAGGDFRPCCTIYSADGRKLSRTFPTETMAAGDTSGVTYAPL